MITTAPTKIRAGEDFPLAEDFFNAILIDANNTVPEKSHWIGFFTTDSNSLTDTVKSMAGEKDYAKWGLGEKSQNMANTMSNNIKQSIMFIAGVEIPGDGFEVTRPTLFNVGGFLKSPITSPRNDLPMLEVTFLENNSSLVDLVIRPWLIASSYDSLKFAYRANFTIYNLTKSPDGFKIRKRFDFFNVVPMSIDTEKYTYEASTDFQKRQLKFVYTNYTVSEGESLIQDFGDSIQEVVNDAVATHKGRLATLAGKAIKVVKDTVLDIVKGGVDHVVTNVTGAFTGAIRSQVVNLESKVRGVATKFEDKTIASASKFINNAIGRDGNKDNINHGVPHDMSTAGAQSASEYRQIPNPVNDSRATTPYAVSQSTTIDGVSYVIRPRITGDTPAMTALPIDSVNLSVDDNVRR